MEILGRLRPYWAWLLSVVLVAGALAVVFLTGPDAGSVETRPGQFVSDRIDREVEADNGTLMFPLGTVSVRLTPAITGGGPARRTPPEDGSFLGIEAFLRPTTPYVIVDPAGSAGDEATPTLALVVIADGRRYPLPDPSIDRPAGQVSLASDASGYLAVAGRPKDVRVEATLDGVRQTVRPSTGARDVGPAAGLYRKAEVSERGQRSCGRSTVTAGYRGEDDQGDLPDCMLNAQARTPYVAGLGWAASGHTWQVVDLDVGRSLRVERVVPGRPVQTYFSVSGDDDLSVRIDGRPSAGSPRVNAGSDSTFDSQARAVVQVALDAPPATVQIVATYHRLRNRSNGADPKAPVGPDVSVTWTGTLS